MSSPDSETAIAMAIAYRFLNDMKPTEVPRCYPVDDENVVTLAALLLKVKAILPWHRDAS